MRPGRLGSGTAHERQVRLSMSKAELVLRTAGGTARRTMKPFNIVSANQGCADFTDCDENALRAYAIETHRLTEERKTDSHNE